MTNNTVLVGGRAVESCLTPVSRADRQIVQTIEGLATGDNLHPVQEAFLAENAFQCGYCTPGLIMSVVILMGALKMKKLESYNFALTATIIAMVPCISPCCLVGLPIGIWALVVLMKPEVKAAFRTS